MALVQRCSFFCFLVMTGEGLNKEQVLGEDGGR